MSIAIHQKYIKAYALNPKSTPLNTHPIEKIFNFSSFFTILVFILDFIVFYILFKPYQYIFISISIWYFALYNVGEKCVQ